jgi:hypothetical protein
MTFVILASIATKSHTEREATLVAVRRYCLDAGLDNAETELIDTMYSHRMRDIAVGPDDATAIETWNKLLARVVEYLATTSRQNNCSWSTIDFVRRGTSDAKQECPLTIVIGTKDSTTSPGGFVAYETARL